MYRVEDLCFEEEKTEMVLACRKGTEGLLSFNAMVLHGVLLSDK